MRTYEFMSKQYGFKMDLPASWEKSLMARLLRLFSGTKEIIDSSGSVSYQTVLSGPNGESLHILIAPLAQTESEPTVEETERFFETYAYNHGLNDIGSGVIHIAGKDHFWAKYYETGREQIVLIKKYSLVLNKVEYVVTARLGSAFRGNKFTEEGEIRKSEQVYDEIVTSFRLTHH